MKIGLEILRRFTDLPEPAVEVRRWMDRVGLEVKRFQAQGEDARFTLELLANRGDHHCYEGLARELAGRLARPLRTPPVADLAVGAPPWPLRLETELVLRYSATLLEATGEPAPLDASALAVLEASAMAPVGPVVDATNVAHLELGQPTHAFDADTLRGAVTLRLSRPGERAWPLFRPEPVELPSGTLVVADDEKVLAIAGVIGCEESKTTDSTRRVLLESATFDPVSVRKASRALGIGTDSSARFERGADPERVLVGAGRVVELLERTGSWRRVGPTGLVGAWRNPGRVVSARRESLTAALGMEFGPAELVARLARYGFETRVDAEDRVHASVPTWRLWDVEFPADLVEELAKSVGYENFTPSLPPVSMGSLPSPAEAARDRADEVLLGLGCYEVFTDGFYGRSAVERLGLAEDHPLHRHVETTNALDRAYSLLKNNTLHQALEAVAANERRRVADVKMFEWTRTFHPVPRPLASPPDRRRPPCVERKVLWLAAAGTDRPRQWEDTSRPADLAWLRGVVSELAVELGVDLEVAAPGPDHPLADRLHPGRRQAVFSGGRQVGLMGEPHPSVLRAYKIRSRPVWLELEVEALFAEPTPPAWSDPPATQPIVRALAFSLPHRLEAGHVAAVLHAHGPDGLERVEIGDLFRYEEAGQPLRAVTYHLQFSGEPARTAEEVNVAVDSMARAVLETFGATGVRQR